AQKLVQAFVASLTGRSHLPLPSASRTLMRTSIVRPLAGIILGGALITGCEAKKSADFDYETSPASAEATHAPAGETASVPRYALQEGADGLVGDSTVVRPAESNRKIIYTATVELAVEDFTGTPERVAELVRSYDGYLAGSNLSGETGESRRGTWKIRIPVE